MYKQNYSALWIHLVWSTKHRQPLITKALQQPLYDFIRVKAKEIEVHPDFINGVSDHLHFLVSIQPKHCISDIVKSVKGASSKWINDNNLSEEHFDWQDGFGAFSVSPSHLAAVRSYIKNQEKHHATINFEDEMRMLKERVAKFK